MLKSIYDDVRQQFDYGNKVTQLIIVNTAVYILINLVRLGFVLASGFKPGTEFEDIILLLSLHSDLMYDATHPWVIFTHMFVHVGFFHFLFNMLFLYWFGRIVADLIGDHRTVPLYLLSGLFAAVIYLLTAPLIHDGGSHAYGASAAVMGFVMAAGLLAPNYLMHLLLIGEVKLKYVVLALILIDLFAVGSMDNTGGHIAHLGGVAFGAIFVSMLRRGNDLSVPLNKLADWFTGLFRRRQRFPGSRSSKVYVRHSSVASAGRKQGETAVRPKIKGAHVSDLRPSELQARLDAILDKIKENGYDSLTAEEKEFLFLASKK